MDPRPGFGIIYSWRQKGGTGHNDIVNFSAEYNQLFSVSYTIFTLDRTLEPVCWMMNGGKIHWGVVPRLHAT